LHIAASLNRKSEKASAIMERVLHLQMRQTGAEARIAQLLLDSVRYGFAPTKINWDNRTNANQIVGFDPRRCYPDPRVTWGDWAAMQFIGFTSFGSYDQFAQTGIYPKMKKYPGLRILNDAIPTGWENHLWLREEMQWLNVNPMQPSVTQSDHPLLQARQRPRGRAVGPLQRLQIASIRLTRSGSSSLSWTSELSPGCNSILWPAIPHRDRQAVQ
jgi:hypothetical protein